MFRVFVQVSSHKIPSVMICLLFCFCLLFQVVVFCPSFICLKKNIVSQQLPAPQATSQQLHGRLVAEAAAVRRDREPHGAGDGGEQVLWDRNGSCNDAWYEN